MKNKKPLGIYVHIPFCKSKCHYCDFCSSPANDKTKSEYVKALIDDISSETARNYFSDHVVDTIYLGGGTPTCLAPDVLDSIINAILSVYSVSNEAEITAECNPGTVNYDDLSSLRQSGFNRLSLGLQSTHDNELNSLGRIHNFKDFDSTFDNARKAGFNNISVDLMYGIPQQTLLSFEQTLRTLINYSPEHISAYSLKIEPGTNFFKNKENLMLPDEDCEYNMYESAVNILGSAGYSHYEISNYAKVGYISKHNFKYWNCDDYAGFGVSAHSCIGTNRYSTTPFIEKYLNSYERPSKSYVSLEESLSLSEFAEEYIMMRMRLSFGISMGEFANRFGFNFKEKYFSRLLPFIKSGHIICNDDSIYFSNKGMYISNYILSSILDLNQ